MKVSELAQRSGVPISSIKFYIRQKLLPRGERTTASNQAVYGENHLERLLLIAALKDVAGLPNDTLRAVFDAMQPLGVSDADPIHKALVAVYPQPTEVPAEMQPVHDEVRTFLLDLPWTTEDERYFWVGDIASSVVQIRRYLDPDFGETQLRQLADQMWRLSEVEFQLAPGDPVPAMGDDMTATTKRSVLGMLLFEPVLLALRRCANAARGQRMVMGLPLPPTAK